MSDIPLRCRCGTLRGTALGVSRDTGNRTICYCTDCQAFARFLGTDGILDAHGGSDIFQLTPSQIRIDAGKSELTSMRLGPKGLLRWYAACCKTPVANVMATMPRLPFAGLIQPFMDHSGGPSRDEALGPPRMYVNAKSAVNGAPDVDTKLKVGTLIHGLGLLGGGFLRGKHRPTPFFDDLGRPMVIPEILTLEARQALTPKT